MFGGLVTSSASMINHPFQLENSGNLPDFSSPVPITYWDAVYFLMVTMSTVG